MEKIPMRNESSSSIEKEEKDFFSKWHGNDYFKTAGQPFPILFTIL